jgi:hypothetical protein
MRDYEVFRNLMAMVRGLGPAASVSLLLWLLVGLTAWAVYRLMRP